MENRIQCFLITAAGTVIASVAIGALPCISFASEEDLSKDPLQEDELILIETQEPRDIRIADIDTENFEIGIAGGVLSVEDFETNPVAIASLTYHVTEDFFIESRYAASTIGESSFEKLSGSASLLSDQDRHITLYDISLGINLFPGEAFILDRWAVNSYFHVSGGVGAIEFAGNQEFTVNAGFGYKVIINDFMALNLSVRDHLFDTEITGAKKRTNNFEVSAGVSVFF